MRVIKTLLILFVATLVSTSGFAQQRTCATMDHLESRMCPKLEMEMEKIEKHTHDYVNNPDRNSVLVSIPVVVHVIYRTATENISDAQVLSQIDILNEDFRRMNADQDDTWSQAADSEIEFCLAQVDPNGAPTNGIVRVSTTVNGFGTNDGMKFTAQGGSDAWDRNQYMNMWVCNIGGGILGYAQFPGGAAATDGIAIDYRYYGNMGTATPPFNLGRTATHEVGHYLNLRHIWGDGPCGQDDFVADTPESDASNFGCPTTHQSCGSTDMVQNYMDYTDDSCMNLYTEGQKARMQALLAPGGFRASLATSAAIVCGPPPDPTCDDGIQNQGETGIDCGGPCPDVCPTCDDGIQNQGETGIDCGGPNCDTCPCYATSATVTINLDDYPEETSWEITDENGAIIASGGTYPNEPDGSTVTQDVDLSSGCYTFTINDTYGDGICCNYGTGSYIVSADGCDELVSGGQFGFSESTTFCLTDPAEDTATACADGIDNDGDGLIDCDDPDCQAIAAGCATCGDGSSFADAVLEYAPACPANISLGDAMSAVGLSDSDGSANYVSLGEGGALMLAFVDNVLVNSGSADADLLVFEVDGDVEACMIELRPYDMATENALMAGGVMDADGDGYYEMGMVAGGSATLDIDAMISANAGDLVFDAVKIMDVDDGACMGTSAGADIDAICALSSVPCSTFYMDADSDGFGDDNTTADVCALTAPAGYVAIGGDCDDTNAAINPGAPEACNEIDDNCNAQTDEGLPAFTYYADADSDGFGDPSGVLNTCETSAPAGYVDNNDDCDDTDAIANPSNTEVCNGVDDNCDGQIDEGFTFTTYYEDNDSDGFGSSNPNNSISVCDETAPAGYTTNNDDCNDNDANINPNASETCNGTDDNCNNETDEGLATQTYYQDADNDGYGNADVSLDDCEQPNGYTLDNTDCDDNNSQVNPGQTEDPDNNIDDDCDGVGMVSTVDLQREELFTISPNPTQSFVSIESNVTGFINARLVNQVGQSVLETSFVLSNNRQNIYLDNIPAGVYYFVFNNKNGEHIGLNKLVVLK